MPPTEQAPQIILGTHTFGDASLVPGVIHFDKQEDVKAVLDKFYSRGYKAIDTAQNYPGSEDRLGKAGAASRFTIHTKVRDGPPGSHEPAKLEASIEGSLKSLGTDSTETMFLHVPDHQTPFEDTVAAMDKAIRQGKFKKFGISNYGVDEVQKILSICEDKGYIKPSVYQGHYNAIVRAAEKDLIPLLRKHGMSFFAYSPAAAGLFTGNAGKSEDSKRWSNGNIIGQAYNRSYGLPQVDDAVAVVRDAAQKHGISGHAAALRWAEFHSILDGKHGDAIIFAVRNIQQLEQSLDAFDAGPLPADLADAISAVYKAFEGGKEPPFHL